VYGLTTASVFPVYKMSINRETIFILLGLGLMVFAFWFAIAYGSNATNSTKINCDRMMYSDNWTLGYLREIAKLCSNGG